MKSENINRIREFERSRVHLQLWQGTGLTGETGKAEVRTGKDWI